MQLLLVAVSAAVVVLAQPSTNVPPYLSACMAPYPESYSAATCMSNWTLAISSCIDASCSVSVSSAIVNTRTSMFFTPSHDTSCQQASINGVTQPDSMLQLRPGICQMNSYRFESFLVSTGQNGIQQDCSLGLFEGTQCAGGTREVPLNGNSASSGECWVVGGQSVMLSCGEGGDASDNQAAYSYISSFCSISGHTQTSTRLQSSTTLIAADTTTLATTIASNSTSSNLTAGTFGDPATPANTTSLATTSIVVIIPSTVSVSGEGVEEKMARKGGAAQWALVVLVFARSLMY
ncbi:hypothetical protein E4T42_01842 [Aureobasidium subglaciale]|nr:hypothetical protein E4T42_01842 [Aureobasidium subglaciale]